MPCALVPVLPALLAHPSLFCARCQLWRSSWGVPAPTHGTSTSSACAHHATSQNASWSLCGMTSMMQRWVPASMQSSYYVYDALHNSGAIIMQRICTCIHAQLPAPVSAATCFRAQGSLNVQPSPVLILSCGVGPCVGCKTVPRSDCSAILIHQHTIGTSCRGTDELQMQASAATTA